MRNVWIVLMLFVSVIANAQTKAQDYVDKAVKAADQKQFSKSIDLMTKAIALAPDSFGYYYLRGAFYYANKDNKAADADFLKSTQINPADYNPFFEAGFFYAETNNVDKAEEYYTKGLAIPNLSDSARYKLFLYRGTSKFIVLDLDAAEKDYMEAYKIDSNRVGVVFGLSNIARERGNFEECERLLLICHKKNPDDESTIGNLGFLYIQMKKYKEAIPFFDKTIALSKNYKGDYDLQISYAYAHSNRGYCKFKLGREKEALADFAISIEVVPTNSYVYKNRAELYIKQNKFSAACFDLNTAISLGFADQYGDEVDKLIEQYCK